MHEGCVSAMPAKILSVLLKLSALAQELNLQAPTGVRCEKCKTQSFSVGAAKHDDMLQPCGTCWDMMLAVSLLAGGGGAEGG